MTACRTLPRDGVRQAPMRRERRRLCTRPPTPAGPA